jgi:hypothetical protein
MHFNMRDQHAAFFLKLRLSIETSRGLLNRVGDPTLMSPLVLEPLLQADRVI